MLQNNSKNVHVINTNNGTNAIHYFTWHKTKLENEEDGGEIGGSGVHFPSKPVKYLADLRSKMNSQQYSSIYEDRRPKIEDIDRSDGKKSA